MNKDKIMFLKDPEFMPLSGVSPPPQETAGSRHGNTVPLAVLGLEAPGKQVS